MNDLTVCITNFQRARYLNSAIHSCQDAGITKIVIFSMQPDIPVHYTAGNAARCHFHSLPVDLGLHETWLQAAYRATTDRVLILHDDDMLSPDFGDTYQNTIKPVLDRKEAGFASWRGHCRSDDGTIREVDYFKSTSGVYPSERLREVLVRKGQLSLSPIVSIFNRSVLIRALKESTGQLPYLRPGMELGTEIVAYLRHCDAFKNWFYLHRVLSYYGSHPGSGTVQAESSGNLKPLTDGYDVARNFCLRNKPAQHTIPRILLGYWPGLDNERVRNARKTWDYQFNLGDMLDCPQPSFTTPTLHEIMDKLAAMALPEDILAYADLDLAFTIDLPARILAKVRRTRGVCVAWRRSMEFDPNQHFKSVRQGVKDGGVDMFACSAEWWRKHRERIPLLYVSSTYWDWVVRSYCERVELECYLDDGTYHAPHPALFDKLKLTTPEQRHNHSQAYAFFNSIGRYDALKSLEADQK